MYTQTIKMKSTSPNLIVSQTKPLTKQRLDLQKYIGWTFSCSANWDLDLRAIQSGLQSKCFPFNLKRLLTLKGNLGWHFYLLVGEGGMTFYYYRVSQSWVFSFYIYWIFHLSFGWAKQHHATKMKEGEKKFERPKLFP